jgi:hypothetical protein
MLAGRSYDSHAHGAISHGTHCHLFRRSLGCTVSYYHQLDQLLCDILVSTFWYVWVMFVSSKFPPTNIERERRHEDLGLLLDNTNQTTIITLYWGFATRTSKWTRDFVWTSLWSKEVSSGGNLLAGSNFCPVSGCHTHMCG